jgi:hypothetical protein
VRCTTGIRAETGKDCDVWMVWVRILKVGDFNIVRGSVQSGEGDRKGTHQRRRGPRPQAWEFPKRPGWVSAERTQFGLGENPAEIGSESAPSAGWCGNSGPRR